jgi:hypothetical protein
MLASGFPSSGSYLQRALPFSLSTADSTPRCSPSTASPRTTESSLLGWRCGGRCSGVPEALVLSAPPPAPSDPAGVRPCTPHAWGWQADPEELAAAVGPDTAAMLAMTPAMPTGTPVLPGPAGMTLNTGLPRFDGKVHGPARAAAPSGAGSGQSAEADGQTFPDSW